MLGEARRRCAPQEGRLGEPADERRPDRGGQCGGHLHGDPAHGLAPVGLESGHGLLAPDRRQLSEHRLSRPHRVVEQDRVPQQTLHARVGQHERQVAPSAVVTVAVGSGAKSLGCGGRSTVSACASTVVDAAIGEPLQAGLVECSLPAAAP